MIIAAAFKSIREHFILKRAKKNKEKVAIGIIGKAKNIKYYLASLQEDTINIKGFTYVISKENIYFHNGAPILLYNIEDAAAIDLHKLESGVSSDYLDKLLLKAKMAAQTKGVKTQLIMLYACLIAAGAALVTVLLVFKMQVRLDEVYKAVQTLQGTISTIV